MGICLYCRPVWFEVLGAVSLLALTFALKPHVRGRDEGRDSRICDHGSHTPCSRFAYCIMTKDHLLLIFGSPAP